MPFRHHIYLEVGSKRVFAGAIDWPGWCRSGRDEDAAVQALVAYGRRYAAAVGSRAGFKPPKAISELRIVERLEGNATTDFGAPGIAPPSDQRPVDDTELERLTGVLKASWSRFDRVARAARGASLRKGPRGGGRQLDAIVVHVLEADESYLTRLGGKSRDASGAGADRRIAGVRRAILEAIAARAHGEPLPERRRSSTVWTPRYGVRRSAWHALDHAWEVEDRADR